MGDFLPDYEFVLVTENARQLDEARVALSASGIEHRVDLMPGPPARALVSVPKRRSQDAQRVLAVVRGDEEDEGEDEPPEEGGRTGFPWRPALAVLGVVGIHLALVLLAASPLVDRWSMMRRFGVLDETTWQEPWRLLTSLFVHSDFAHAAWNGLSMLVFAVPLLEECPWRRVAGLYLLAGLGGAVLASAVNEPTTVTIGSSGAVAGLFGAWVVRRLQHPPLRTVGRRAALRAWGIALLVLPSLLSPATADGRRISVASHVGGLLVGLALGSRLGAFPARREAADDAC